MYKKILLTLYIALLPAFCFPQGMTLNEAVSTALKNNNRIKQYREKLEQKRYEDLQAWGNFLPKIDLTASYNHLNNPLIMDLEPVRQAMIQLQSANQVEFANIYNLMQSGAPLSDAQRAALFGQYSAGLNGKIPAFTATLKEQDYKSAAITGVQPLFMGGKLIAAKNYASDEKHSAEIEIKQVEDEVINETVQTYLGVVLLQEIVKTREDVLAGMEKHKNQADKLLKQGLIANYNYLRAEVAVADADRNLSDDKNKLEVAMLAFKNTIGVEFSDNITINDSLFYKNVNDSLEILIEEAYAEQPVLKLIEQKKDAASQNYNVQRSSFLPTIAAFGKYEFYPEYLSIMEPRWIVGIQASFNLFNGLKDYGKLQAASHLEDEVKYLEADARKKIELLVNKNYRDVLNARDRYVKAEATIKLADENLRLNSKRFDTGLGTSLEVIDAQLSLERVKIDRVNSLYEYYKSLSNLYLSTGNTNRILSIWNEGK